MHVKILHKMYPWKDDHKNQKPKGSEEYNRFPFLNTYPCSRVGRTWKAIPSTEQIFQDNCVEEKAEK